MNTSAKIRLCLALPLFSVVACANSGITDGSSAAITAPPQARNERPSWTPDGERIVFSSKRDGNYEIYIMNKDGTEQNNLTRSEMAELFPSVSGKGDQIAFVGEAGGNYDIYVMGIDGDNKKRLTSEPRIEDWPSWRDNDDTLVFDFVDDDDYGIMRMGVDGSNRETLIDDNARTVDPSTNNASDWVVYSSDELDPGGDDAIFAVHMITGEIKQLSNLSIDAGAPSLSPDGKKVVFNAGDEHWDLYIMNLDGNGVKQLTSDAGDNKWGAFSPDGSEIAFTSNRNGGWHIFVMNADGTNLRQLTFEAMR